MNAIEEHFNGLSFKVQVVIRFPSDPDLVLNWTVPCTVNDMTVDATKEAEARFLAAMRAGGMRIESIRRVPDKSLAPAPFWRRLLGIGYSSS